MTEGDAAPGTDGVQSAGPDADGWYIRAAGTRGDFIDPFGEMKVRIEAPGRVRVRIETSRAFANPGGGLHGGFLMAFVDQVLFMGAMACGVRMIGGATIDASTQFLAPGEVGKPLDAVVELLRETGRMVFVRGTLEQDGEAKVAFSGTLRKPR